MTTIFRSARRVTWLATIAMLLGFGGWCEPCCSQPGNPKQPSPSKSTKQPTVRSIDEMLLFFPTKYPEGNWKPAGLQFEDLWCDSEDKTRIHGWYCPCDQPRAVVMIAHGNGGHVASRAEWLKVLQTKLRVSAYVFDYRGYGRSGGVPTVAGAVQDGKAARAALAKRAGVAETDVVLMGESLGGAIACQLAADKPPRGLVLQSTFSSLKEVAAFHFPKLAWLVPDGKLDSMAKLAAYRGPLLHSHGTVDRTIPFAQGEKLFGVANQPKTFLRIAGADHNDWLTAEYLRELDSFIQKLNEPK